MAETHPSYKKLPGRVVGPGVTRLWYDADHLISVTSVFGYESYQRVYFREVEAFLVRRTNTRLIWNIVFGVVFGTAVAFGAMLGSGTVESPAFTLLLGVMIVLLGVPALIAFIGLLVNTARGTMCTFWVQTAGGTMRLGAPVRVRTAEKILNIIGPLIAQAQSEQQVNPVPTP